MALRHEILQEAQEAIADRPGIDQTPLSLTTFSLNNTINRLEQMIDRVAELEQRLDELEGRNVT